jgi:hypothetical protein
MLFDRINQIRGLLIILVLLMIHVSYPTPVKSASDKLPELGLPLQCEPGVDCWIVNFVDLDKSKNVRDHRCSSFGYDGHKGTDISIRDLKAMRDGVPVVASAPGIVIGTRDGMSDVGLANGRAAISGRECGNTAAIHHGGGWVTQYCHMRKGSVLVKKGQRVKRGDRLGLVGLSGNTQFPHVHISLRLNKRVIDPFIGTSPGEGCGDIKKSFWTSRALSLLSGTPTAIFNAGFAAKKPIVKSIRAGLYKDKVLSRSAPVLLLWADMYWAQKGDVLEMKIIDPDGSVIHAYKNTIKKTRARQLFYAGKKRKPLFWPAGEYRGEITLLRPGGGETSPAMKAVRTVTLK